MYFGEVFSNPDLQRRQAILSDTAPQYLLRYPLNPKR